jgi:hypothetical protein
MNPNRAKTVAVFFDGPFPTTARDDDEIPEWTVYAGDEYADPDGPVYRLRSYAAARNLAERMATDRRLELVDEATTA